MLDMDGVSSVAGQAVLEPLSREVPEKMAVQVRDRFLETYRVLVGQLRSPSHKSSADFERLERRIIAWQAGVTAQGFETKLWSRHVLMAIALESVGLSVTQALVNSVVDHYWRVLRQNTNVFPDAAAAVERLFEEQTRFVFGTNSDGFLRFDEPAQTFYYDPEDATRRKLHRLECLRTLGVKDAQICVGDPIGKPRGEFYDRVLDSFARFFGAPPDLSCSVAVGDSLTNDVLPLLDRGVRWGAWLQRSRVGAPAPLEGEPQVMVISNLADLWRAPWPDTPLSR